VLQLTHVSMLIAPALLLKVPAIHSAHELMATWPEDEEYLLLLLQRVSYKKRTNDKVY